MAGARPNIILFVADDHRGAALRHLGGTRVRTPMLDTLAAAGYSFSQAHSQGSMHGAVCVPSRASLLTGRSIFASSADPTGLDFERAQTIPDHIQTVPQVLRANGYQTHAIGKWHNDRASFNRSFAGGRALFFGGMSDHYHVPLHDYDPSGAYSPEAVHYENRFSTDIFADAAIDFLEHQHGDSPFFLYVAFTAPHDPRTPPARWSPKASQIEITPNVMPMPPFDNGELQVRDELVSLAPRSITEIRHQLAAYYGMIAHLDHAVGQVLRVLQARAMDEETVVIYTSDHGLAVGQHGLMGKQNLYEHSLRVPLVMSGPGVPSGEISSDLVWHGDTAATIRALGGVEPDAEADGFDLLARDRGARRHELAAAFGYGQRAFRNDRFKLIRYTPVPGEIRKVQPDTTPGSEFTQLFDLEQDPEEIHNIAEMPLYATVRRELETGLRAWQKSVDDPLLEYAAIS